MQEKIVTKIDAQTVEVKDPENPVNVGMAAFLKDWNNQIAVIQQSIADANQRIIDLKNNQASYDKEVQKENDAIAQAQKDIAFLQAQIDSVG